MSQLHGKVSSNMIRKFRRNPRVALERGAPAFVKWPLRVFFRVADRKGFLSDIFADPQLIYESWWPYRFFRRKIRRDAIGSVSVIVATHNNEATIRASLVSLMNQSARNIEIIVVDDGSTDNSPSLIKELQNRDDRIRVVTNAVCIGTGASRNIGLAVATGDYVTFQDGDDISSATRIERQLREFFRDPMKKLVTCNYVRVNSRGERLEVNDRRVMKCIISMMFPRQEVLDHVGYFREKNVSEDADYFERIKIFFGDKCEVSIFRTLYEAQFREDSSFFSSCEDVRLLGRKVQFARKQAVAAEWDGLLAQHEQMKQGRISPYNLAGPLK